MPWYCCTLPFTIACWEGRRTSLAFRFGSNPCRSPCRASPADGVLTGPHVEVSATRSTCDRHGPRPADSLSASAARLSRAGGLALRIALCSLAGASSRPQRSKPHLPWSPPGQSSLRLRPRLLLCARPTSWDAPAPARRAHRRRPWGTGGRGGGGLLATHAAPHDVV